jgi:hypothetical protein
MIANNLAALAAAVAYFFLVRALSARHIQLTGERARR